MATYQTMAIILKREDIFEADRLYHLYTENFGMVRAIAGSVRKISAKLTGHLEPFSVIWVELMTKKNGDLFITTALSETNLLDSGAVPGQISLVAKMSQFALKMLRGQEKDDVMWHFMLESFNKAGSLEAERDIFLEKYKSDFASIMGFGDNFAEAQYYLGDFDAS